MADERKFRFVSPGVYITEIDRSQIPTLPDLVGPAIVGRAARGPAFTPIRISSLSEFENVFGGTVPGTQQPGDVWRFGALNAPMYSTYAASAYLTVGATPITYMRLLGVESDDASASGFGAAGFDVGAGTDNAAPASTAGAFGLFLFQSGTTSTTGTLAAVVYSSGSAFYPSGTLVGGDGTGAGMNILIESDSTSPEFVLEYQDGVKTYKQKISLEVGATNYIRDVLNTNPQLIDYRRNGLSSTYASVENPNSKVKYWLGETYERAVKEEVIDLNGTNTFFAAMIPLKKETTSGLGDRTDGYREAHTPWFISQDLSANTSSFDPTDTDRVKRLFKFVTLDGQGEFANKGLKVSIANVAYSPNDNVNFGSFDVLIRRAGDNDNQPDVVEQFSGVNLNPNSADYIVARIGNSYREFDQADRVLKEYGEFPNISQYVRVVVGSAVEAGDTPALLPFGYYGIPKFATAIASGSQQNNFSDRWVSNKGYSADTNASTNFIISSSQDITASIGFPDIPVRLTASRPTTKRINYFGVSAETSQDSGVYSEGYVDYTRFLGSSVIGKSNWVDDFGLGSLPTGITLQDAFTLDELVVTRQSNYNFATRPRNNILEVTFTSGSRVAGTAFNCSSSATGAPTSTSYKNILDAGFNKFTAPFFGGFDGLDITERDPLRNNLMRRASSPTIENNYVLNTYETAIDILSDTEQYEYNMLSLPGVWYSPVTDKVIETCEERGDALGIIDLEGGYIPPHEQYYTSAASRKGSVDTVLTNLDARNLNNSYGATYYPWVLARDGSGAPLRLPPSVPAIGVLARTEAVSDVWFAPAGFNRGGLSNGGAGITITSVDEVLNSADRDRLYASNVNPIARFPAEGIVVFGQKTLQATPSALDRINVRRLLIFLKKGISRIASATLFEQNVPATWRRFKNAADDFLSAVKVGFGLDDYRIVLDETTTTPDLVDRNILYAKVFIKPTRSIEFIALDFLITRSGASFDD